MNNENDSSLLTDIDKTIKDLISEKYLPKNKRFSYKFFAKSCEELSLAFTSERSSRYKNYFNLPPMRASYLLYFFIQTFVKTKYCLKKALKLGFKIDNVLDVGAGSGASGICAGTLGAKNVLMLDQNKKSMLDGIDLTKKLRLKTDFSYEDTDVLKWNSNKKFDLILSVNFLNELNKDKQFDIAKNLISNYLENDGCLIIIEPALQFTTRNLMKLRNDLIQEGFFTIAPCLHQKPCPMLMSNQRDWCHMYLHWQRPETIFELDKITKRNHRYLKFAYMIISKKRPKPIENKGLIVSSPLISKGKTEILACNSNGNLDRLRILHKNDRSKFTDLNRGDIVDL